MHSYQRERYVEMVDICHVSPILSDQVCPITQRLSARVDD